MIETMKSRKGITPVIAIVLLLLLTVGAVGVVWTQFQGLVSGDTSQQVQKSAKQRNADLSIINVNKTRTGSGTKYYMMTVANNGGQTINFGNLSGRTEIGLNGNSPRPLVSAGGSCKLGAITANGGTETCNTSIQWEGNDDGLGSEFVIYLGSNQKDAYTCFETASQSYCRQG